MGDEREPVEAAHPSPNPLLFHLKVRTESGRSSEGVGGARRVEVTKVEEEGLGEASGLGGGAFKGEGPGAVKGAVVAVGVRRGGKGLVRPEGFVKPLPGKTGEVTGGRSGAGQDDRGGLGQSEWVVAELISESFD